MASPPSLPVALALLNLTTVLWGTQHAMIKLSLVDPSLDPSSLTLLRFALAAVIAAPPLFLRPSRATLARAAELSVYLFAGYALQSLALLTTSASRSAFLLYLNVKLVPFLSRFLYGRAVRPLTWASAFVALCGTGLLTYDGSPPAMGDLFSIAAAIASALFILRTESAGRDVHVNAAQLNAATLTGVAVLAAVWHFASGGHLTLPATPVSTGAIVYLAIVTTAVCNYIQAIGQRGVSAERAAVVFALDPVYGAAFAWLLLGEQLGPQGFVGAAFIVAAAVASAIADRPGKVEKDGPDQLLETDLEDYEQLIPPGEDVCSSTRSAPSSESVSVSFTRQVGRPCDPLGFTEGNDHTAHT